MKYTNQLYRYSHYRNIVFQVSLMRHCGAFLSSEIEVYKPKKRNSWMVLVHGDELIKNKNNQIIGENDMVKARAKARVRVKGRAKARVRDKVKDRDSRDNSNRGSSTNGRGRGSAWESGLNDNGSIEKGCCTSSCSGAGVIFLVRLRTPLLLSLPLSALATSDIFVSASG